jgi:mRNA interferase MazF
MKTPIKRFDVWMANLNSPNESEPGRKRTVVIIQSDLLNSFFPSTLMCPLTANIITGSEILRVNLAKSESGIKKRAAVQVDQLRPIDNRRLLKKIGTLNKSSREKLRDNLKIVLDL